MELTGPTGPVTAAAPGYPAEPWDLHGRAVVGVWLLPRGLAPAPHSSATTALTLFGRRLVGAAFFAYEEPSPLTYDEVMATVLVREGWRPRVSVTHIWVDSPASLAGGRALWAIPKELADFTTTDRGHAAAGIGAVRATAGRGFPFRVPLAFRTAQDRDGTLVVSPVRGRARVGVASGRWTFEADGPLAFLAGRRPVLTLTLRPFRLLFGRAGVRASRAS